MGLIGCCGPIYGYNMGNHKTYTATKLAYLDHKLGRRIIANYHLNQKEIPYTYADSIFEVNDLLTNNENCTCVLDELSSWISCYEKPNSKNGGMDLKILSQQTRKASNKIIYTAQCYNDIPLALRKLTSKIIITSKNHLINGKMVVCVDDDCYGDNKRNSYGPHYLGLLECVISGDGLISMPSHIPSKDIRYFPVAPQIFNMYNTKEIILRPEKRPENNCILEDPVTGRKRAIVEGKEIRQKPKTKEDHIKALLGKT